MFERAIITADGTVKIERANFPEFKPVDDDLRYLAIAAASHVSAPSGLSACNFSSALKGWTEQDINISVIKLLRLGYIEKKISEDQDGETYFSIFSTDDGIDALIRAGSLPTKNPAPPAPALDLEASLYRIPAIWTMTFLSIKIIDLKIFAIDFNFLQRIANETTFDCGFNRWSQHSNLTA